VAERPETGLAIHSDAGFARVFAPLSRHFSESYWLLDLVAGPFTYLDESSDDSERIEEEMDALVVEAPELEQLSASLWRPGVLPKYADLLWEDEWGYYLCLPGSAPAVVEKIASLPGITPPSDPERFQELTQTSEAYLIQVFSDQWHVFSRHPEWLDLLREHHPSAVAVSSSVYTQSGGY
jgi:hypothetical protein